MTCPYCGGPHTLSQCKRWIKPNLGGNAMRCERCQVGQGRNCECRTTLVLRRGLVLGLVLFWVAAVLLVRFL